MRLRIRLPEVKPDKYVVLLTCPHGCGGRYFALHQCVPKRMGDPNYSLSRCASRRCGGGGWPVTCWKWN